MDSKYMLFRPATLVEGKQYLLRETRGNGTMVVLIPVKFVDYTSSPAFVIVSNGSGMRIRCLREALFSNETLTQDERQLLIIPSSSSDFHPVGI
jgi:hypothetical protein